MWSSARNKVFNIARLWDALAVLVVAFAIWKVFISPRNLDLRAAHPAPRATYDRLDGGVFRLSEQRGQPVFLDFYATWCEPCKLELPLVEKWSAAHPDALVVPIDVGEPRSVALPFARRYGLRNVALDPQSSARPLFSVEGFPTVVVVDRSGLIRAKWEGLNPAIEMALTNAQNNLKEKP